MTLVGWQHLFTPENLLFLAKGFVETLELAAISMISNT